MSFGKFVLPGTSGSYCHGDTAHADADQGIELQQFDQGPIFVGRAAELLLGLAAASQQRVRTAVAMGLPTAGLVSL